MGIEVLVPDVNRSVAEFAPDRSGERRGPPAIVFGLAAVRNVGESLVERIVAERDGQRALRRLLRLLPAGRPGGPQQADHGVARQGRRLRLARATRARACAWCSRRSSTAPSSGGASTTSGITSLFAAFEEDEQADPGWGAAKVAIPDTEFDKAQRLAFEKEMLGLYVSDHPLMGFERRWPGTPTARSRTCARRTPAIGDRGAGARRSAAW